MAKSALMRMLRRAYQIARMSQKTGIPADELLGMVNERRRSPLALTRRRLLQVGLASASALATASFPRSGYHISAQANTPPVLIVGAGIAGLTAGYRLVQAGVPVNIIEARSSVGGRIRTLPKAAGTPIVADLGGEFINTDHICFLSLAQELGFLLVDLLAVDEGLIQDTYFLEGRRVSLEELIQDFVPVAQQVEADLELIDNFEDYTTADEATIAIDRIPLTQYLDQIPTTPIVRQLLRIAYTIEFGLNAEEQSPLNLIYFIGTEPGTFEVFGSSDERFYIDGGAGQVTERLAQLLGGFIETTTVLEAIRSLSDGRYQVSLRSGNSSLERTYERVILTLPFSVLRNVQIDVDLPPVKRQAIDTVGYATNTKIITGYTEKVWRTRFNSRGDVFSDLGFQNTWETSASRYSPGSIGLITNYTGGSQGVASGSGTAEDQAQQFRSQFNVVFPGINSVAIPDKAVRAYWTGSPFSLGSYLCYRPGEFTRFYGVEGERVGNLFFAGEHTSFEYQAYMEGGCETGELVAAEILDELGLGEIAEAIRAKYRVNRSRRNRSNRRPGRNKLNR